MKKKILLLSIIIFLIANFVFAARATEITYPDIPNAITPVSIKTALPEYTKYIFNFFVTISGLICFGVLIYAGTVFLTSAGNPGKQKEATSQIGAAFLGMAIVFGSYLISQTINPQLVIPHIGIMPVEGVIVGTEDCIGGKPGGETRSIMRDTPDFEMLADGTGPFIAKSFKFVSGPGDLKVIFCNQPGYNGDKYLATSDIQHCRNIGQRKSVKFYWQLPGAYLCDSTLNDSWMCPANAKERYLPADTALLESGFNDNVKGIRFNSAEDSVSFGSADDIPRGMAAAECAMYDGDLRNIDGEWICTYTSISYGAVLHEHQGSSGECSVITLPVKDLNNELIKYRTSSITLFPLGTMAGRPANEGVWLCRDHDPVPADLNNPDKCLGPYPEEHQTETYQTEMPDGWNDEVTSIVIHGSYIAILFEGGEHDAYKGVCEVYTESDSNFRDTPIGRNHCVRGCGDHLSSFIILPIKGSGGQGFEPSPPPPPPSGCNYGNEPDCNADNQCYFCNNTCYSKPVQCGNCAGDKNGCQNTGECDYFDYSGACLSQ